ncbi:GNAT family N-acetyltransferase [Arthrobacter sp. BF1]|uniref:GNAT family N-acetyltransferase n=1 Tax=Arthrobacter sp. BF1 TaxID=2821145 RepID=UPI001C4F567E|nr:GNAT family protein [Arthrobacter sp. BF1]
MRLLVPNDAAALTAALARNRDHLAYWEPSRPQEYYTQEWQATDIASRLADHATGTAHPFALVAGDAIVGRFNLAGIVRGPFQTSILSYWVDGRYTGRGLACAAVQAIIESARADLGLHRIEASTLLDNAGSQRALLKSGFQQIGMAPQYLKIAGKWQDHNLYQMLLHS